MTTSMNRIGSLLPTVIVLVFSVTGAASQRQKTVTVDVDYVPPANLREMTGKSDAIALVETSSNRAGVGATGTPSTVHRVQILDVIKDTTGLLQEGETVEVVQMAGAVLSDQGPTLKTSEQPFPSNTRWILFLHLTPSRTFELSWGPFAVVGINEKGTARSLLKELNGHSLDEVVNVLRVTR